jgi:hypothetical protein
MLGAATCFKGCGFSFGRAAKGGTMAVNNQSLEFSRGTIPGFPVLDLSRLAIEATPATSYYSEFTLAALRERVILHPLGDLSARSVETQQ